MRAELKRCISIERRWNRNEVSRESSDKEVNRRPTSLKKFRADAFSGPMVSKAWIGIYNQIIIIITLCNTRKVQTSSCNEPYSSSSFTKQSCSKMALYR